MSVYSGKCDLADFLAGEGGWFNSEGQPVKFNDPDYHGPYYSDELLDFEAFKKKTGGKVYQHYKIKVDKNNRDFVKKYCKNFNYVEDSYESIKEKNKDCPNYKKTDCTYIYWGTQYTSLKELNKKGVWIEVPIYFNTLLDLIPYYPYIISFSNGSHVCISDESYVNEAFKEHLQYGWISEVNYKGELQRHYLEVCKNYFLYKLEERTKIINCSPVLIEDTPGNFKYLVFTSHHYNNYSKADYMHDIEFVWDDEKTHLYWASPKLIRDDAIELSKEDVENYLAEDIKNGTVKIKYVEKCEFPLRIN